MIKSKTCKSPVHYTKLNGLPDMNYDLAACHTDGFLDGLKNRYLPLSGKQMHSTTVYASCPTTNADGDEKKQFKVKEDCEKKIKSGDLTMDKLAEVSTFSSICVTAIFGRGEESDN